MNSMRIGLIGYGEVGKIFASGLLGLTGVATVAAWDLLFVDPAQGETLRRHAADRGIQSCGSMADLCAQSDLLISAVTASSTLSVAQEAAPALRPGSWYLDLNSASPGTKQACAASVESAGAQYVEAGVMTSVPPYGIRVPMLLGGAGASELATCLGRWGMDAQAVSAELGVASAIKMCRSVMIKGLEALVIESLTTARAYGVEDPVLASLKETFPGIDWSEQGAYFFSRVAQHGKRRAEEMRESAQTVREAGFEPLMATAIAAKQQWVADMARAGAFSGVGRGANWQAFADALTRAHRG